jgi:ABC-type microcin C transport system permease subunit YejE
VEALVFDLSSALADSISSLYKRFRHYPSLYVLLLFFLSDETGLSLFLLLVVHHNLISFGSVDIVRACFLQRDGEAFIVAVLYFGEEGL